jgi:hypothetical protein
MPKKTNRGVSRHMRKMAKVKAEALEFKARMYAEGIWPVIPPPFIIVKRSPEWIASLIAKLKEAGRWPLPLEHPASAILTQRENEGTKVNKMVATTEAQFPSKATGGDEASRARARRGRKTVVTPERINTICELLARGESERSAYIRAGIGSTAWGVAKRNSADLRERIARARDQWAQVRHSRHATALYESQAMRAANRKAVKPQPTHQAKLVVWHLMYRVPLYWAAIPHTEIGKACERFNLPLEIWLRQERTFGLLKKVYARRAQLRGQQPLNVTDKAYDSLRQKLPSNNEPINSLTAEQPVSEITEQPLEIPAEKPEQQPATTAIDTALLRWWLNARNSYEAAEEPAARDGIPRLR